MNFISSRLTSFSGKILLVFFLASFTPTLFIALFSKSFVADFIEHETRSNLGKHAKSYALLTYDKLRQFNEQIDTARIDKAGNVLGPAKTIFTHLEKIPVLNLATSGFSASQKPRLSYFFDQENTLFFKIEKLNAKRNGELEIVRATFSAKQLFGNQYNNPFSEPTCVATHYNEVLFCTHDVELDKNSLHSLHHSHNEHEHDGFLTYNKRTYWLVSWELFLPNYFQSTIWDFVIIRPESTLLASLRKFEQFLLPISFLFFLIVSYIVYKFSLKLLAPLSELVNATKQITTGNYDIDLSISGKDEFSELASSFNSMSSNLLFESTKSSAFSKLEESVLSTASIQKALTSNLPLILDIFDALQLTISLVNPMRERYFDTYSAYIESNSNRVNSKHYMHRLNYSDYSSNALYMLNIQEFHTRFNPIRLFTNFSYIWVKEIECNSKVVGFLFLGNNNKQLTNNNSQALVELSERLSIIYTTYQQQSELYTKAHYDDLTELPNRNYLLSKLELLWKKSVRLHRRIALFFIDLDHFKNVNDLSGHTVGNEVLVNVAKRLTSCVKQGDYVARLSGDEFCIVISDLKNIEQATNLADEIIREFKKPFIVSDISYFLGASIGIAIGPANCNNPQHLLENADLAMFKAKQEGRNQFVLFDKNIEKERSTRLSLERQLHFALESKEISLNFQPKIELKSGNLVSAEALARWNHHELGLVPTDEFIALAEESGLINEIGEWILKKACYQFLDWLDKGIAIDTIAVNVSARQFTSKRFTEVVKSTLRETSIPSQCLELEITESAFISDEEFLASELHKIHNLGVKISIDDFGKKYSSLNYLKKIPFDSLKIDREFISDLENDKKDRHIVEVIINIGHILEKKIVAEGIETAGQCEILQKLSCDYGQGYLFSKPLSDIEFLEFASKYIETNSKIQKPLSPSTS